MWEEWMFPNYDKSDTLLKPIQALLTKLLSKVYFLQVLWQLYCQVSASFLQVVAQDLQEENFVPTEMNLRLSEDARCNKTNKEERKNAKKFDARRTIFAAETSNMKQVPYLAIMQPTLFLKNQKSKKQRAIHTDELEMVKMLIQ